jgi:hypothetical protein
MTVPEAFDRLPCDARAATRAGRGRPLNPSAAGLKES